MASGVFRLLLFQGCIAEPVQCAGLAVPFADYGTVGPRHTLAC